MTSGAHRHLKRVAAPKQWGLEKSGGKFAVRMMPGAHSKRLSLPFTYILRRFLKCADTVKEVAYIIKNKMVKVNGKYLKDTKTPVGLFDVITIESTNKHFRLVLNVERKFKLVSIGSDEAKYRFTKARKLDVYDRIPYVRGMDGYSFKFVDPSVKVGDTLKVDILSNTVVGHISFGIGKIAYVYSGTNTGRVGVIQRIENMENGKSFIHLRDGNEKSFTVVGESIMVIGNNSIEISIAKDNGIKLTEYERCIQREKERLKDEDVEILDN